MLIGTGAHAEDDKVETANAIYEIRPDPKNEDIKCVFKGKTRLFCIERELVTFGKPVTDPRFHASIPVYDDCGGSACGRSRTTLLIEKRQGDEDRPQAEAILRRVSGQVRGQGRRERDLDRARPPARASNLSAAFRDGEITISRQAARSEGAAVGRRLHLSVRGSARCLYRPSGRVPRRRGRPAGRQCPPDKRRWKRITPPSRTGKVEAACEAACASKKKPARADFDQQICRR